MHQGVDLRRFVGEFLPLRLRDQFPVRRLDPLCHHVFLLLDDFFSLLLILVDNFGKFCFVFL